MMNTFATCRFLLIITFLVTCFDFTSASAHSSSQMNSDQANLSVDPLTQGPLTTFIIDCLNQQQPIDEIIAGAKKLGYSDEQIGSALAEILQEETPAKASNFKKYLIAGVCLVGVITAIIGCIKLYNYWQNEALYQHDETQPLRIRMTINDRLQYVNNHDRLNEDEKRAIEAEIAADIERGIAQNRRALDIINDIKNAHEIYGFDVITSGKGSLIGSYVQPLGPCRHQMRVLPEEIIETGSAAEFGDLLIDDHEHYGRPQYHRIPKFK